MGAMVVGAAERTENRAGQGGDGAAERTDPRR
jgi:hypothetical protein